MTDSTRNVPFFNYPYVFTSQEDELLAIVRDVGRRGAFILQRDLEQFEQNLAEYVGAKYVVGVANATDGLHLAVRAAGVGPGDEVIFCTHTMVATAAAIHFAGATPVPVECGPDHQIDPQSVEDAVTSRTKAIMPTQLNGRTADMDALQSVADKHGLLIIEDSSQALGARFKGRTAGTFGIAGAISFYPAKTLGCLGDGGCVITNDDSLNEKLRLFRDHGRDDQGDVVAWCMNSRLDVFQNYEIQAENRDRLRDYLKDHGVGTLIQWGGKAVHQFQKLGFTKSLPFTEDLFTKLLMLPMNTSLTDDDVLYVCTQIECFYAD